MTRGNIPARIQVWIFGVEIPAGTDPGDPRVDSCSALGGRDLALAHDWALLAAVGDYCGRHSSVSVGVSDGADDDLIVV